jgi:polysaccharide chain length determinant protein (PEP-CTERM system associated)
MPSAPLSSVADDSMAIRLVEIVRRRKLIAATAFATILAAAVSFALYLPDIYRASALVLVERTISESIVRTPVSGELESRLYVIKQEILSRDRLTELIDRFDLYPTLRPRVGIADVLSQARNDIIVEPAGPEQVSGRTKTVSFTLSYTGDNRDTVAEVTNAVAAFYVQQNDRMRSEEAIHTTQFLRTQLGDAKQQLDRHETAVRDYTARYTGELPQQVGVNLATLERLNTQLRLNGEQQIRIIEQRERLFEGLRDTGVITRVAAGDVDLSPVSLERLRAIDEQRQKLSQAETQSTDRHPDVVRLREQMTAMVREHDQAEATEKRTREREETEARAAAVGDSAAPATQFRRRTMESLEAEITKLRLEEGGVRQTIASFEQRLESSPQRQQEYQTITRDYNAAKDLYDSLLRRYDEAQLNESLETDRAGERFRILEPALPPEGPAAPNRMRLFIMGVLLACVGMGAAVLAREQFDRGFHTVDDIRAFTTVPVLISIPPIGPVPSGRRMRLALGAVSTLVAIVLIGVAAAYLASGNGQLVRMIAF